MPKTHESGHSADDLRQGVTALTADGSITDRPIEEGPFDEFYVSAEQRKEYGIAPDEKPYWARNPAYWGPRGELVDRVRQISLPARGENGGMHGRPVLDKGELVTLGGGTEGDLCLMAVPRDMCDKRQAEIDDARKEYEEGMRATDQGYVSNRETPKEEKEVLWERMRAEREMTVTGGGYIPPNSPTAGMTYTQAVAFMQRTGRLPQVQERQRQLLMGGHHVEVSQEQFSSLMSGRPQKKVAQKVQAAMGDSGFKRNPNSPVEQARRRERGGG